MCLEGWRKFLTSARCPKEEWFTTALGGGQKEKGKVSVRRSSLFKCTEVWVSGAGLGNWKQVTWPTGGMENRQWLECIILNGLRLPDKSGNSLAQLPKCSGWGQSFLVRSYLLYRLLSKASCCTYQHLDCALGQSLTPVLSLVARLEGMLNQIVMQCGSEWQLMEK